MFDWSFYPKAEEWIYTWLQGFKEKNPQIAHLENELLEHTSTRLFDWIDHITLDATSQLEHEIEELGFEQESAGPSYRVFTHRGAKLPSILVRDSVSKHPVGISLKVESIADFLMVRGQESHIEGSPYSPLRRALVSSQNEVALLVIERRGTRQMEPTYPSGSALEDYLSMTERWQSRPRPLENEEEALKKALSLAEEMAELLGKDIAAHIVLEGERKYWESKIIAGQVQKDRQDRLGMGWANHDHHTFRSSRRFFSKLVRLFEILGFSCRERYFAGEKAGWGAQIMENHNAGLVLFLDVDIAPDEANLDFAHHQLAERDKLATVGLWCALHGESILKAGMHHLEAQFNFDRLKQDFAPLGIEMMDPFSDFAHLRQAFTKAEMWKIAPHRIEALLKKGLITPEEAAKFLSHGAVGSHLENLERHQGYKGFNKDSVNRIIQKTDPRKLSV